jgi:hypothetical protein
LPEAPTTGFTTLSLAGGLAGKQAFAIGMVFRKGDVPNGQNLNNLQMTVRNRWPDGSVKFGLIAGFATLVANTHRTVGLDLGSGVAGATLTTTHLQAALTQPVQIDFSGAGSASWSGADWASPFLTVATGPLMSSWIYRKRIGSDAHLVGWLEVRLFANGAVEVLPWVENGYIAVAAPTNKNGSYQFTLGGTARLGAGLAFDLKHHQRTPLLSGAAVSHWLGSDPGALPLHNKAYLMETELVPAYGATVAANAARVTALPATFSPLAQGVFTYDSDSMPSPGYQQPIGLLPEHDVLHLTADDAARQKTARAVIHAGYSAGRYGIHYRDENTHRPLRFSQHPTRVIADGQGFKDNGSSSASTFTPVATGGNPPTWDTAHSPSVGYMAYLITGRWYFMEEVQFAATCNYLGNGDVPVLRAGSQGLVQPCTGAWQTRSCAWDWRSKVHALTVTPDDDTPLRNEFIACVEANIAHFHGRYVAQANNAFGWVLPGEEYNGKMSEIAIWQQHFVTAVFGHAVSLDLPIGATPKANLKSFFAWKAQSAIRMLGTAANFNYINGAPYTVKTGTSLSVASFTNGTGPWPASDAALYASTFTPAPSWMGSTPGVLAFEYQPDYGAAVRGMWGNLQPAIAYAVRHGLPGASAAYARMTSATNWPQFLAQFNVHPVWGVKPLLDAAAVPSWLQGKAIQEVTAIPGTSGTGGVNIDAWGTLVLIDGTATLVSPANGGHNDSSDNRVTSIDLLQNAPAWVQRIAPSPTVVANTDYMPDGKPVSRHGYHHAHYIPQRQRVMLFGAFGWYSNGGGGWMVDGHTVNGSWTWDAAGTWAPLASGRGYGFLRDPVTGNVWTNGGWCWRQATNTWDRPQTWPISVRWPGAYDPTRRLFFTLQFGDSQGYDLGRGLVATKINPDTGVQTAIAFNASAALTQFLADQPNYPGMDYDPVNDQFLFYAGAGGASGRVYVIKPNAGTTWDMSLLALSGAALPPAIGAGINGRFKYIPALRGFMLMPSNSSGMYFFRTG